MILGEMSLADLSPLADHVWQSTLCAAAVWLLTLALTKNRAAVRYWLWLAASAKFLIPFSLLVSLGSQLGWRTAPATAQLHWSFVVEDIGRPFAASAPALQAATPPASNPLPAILFGVWLCGFAVSVTLWLRWWRQMQSARKGAIPVALGLPIPVISSSTRVEPGVVGIRKSVLLLPEGITDRLTPDQLDAVLAHEMCHVRRRDNLTAVVHMVVEAVFWFYPLVWWIRARLVEERERACDEGVLQSGSDAEVYAEGILNVCRFYIESPLPCVSGISGADLKKRIVRIMTERTARKLDFSRKLLLSAAGLVAVAVPIVFGLVNATPSRAQSQAENKDAFAPVYEVASIKTNRSANGMERIGFTPDGFTATGATLQMLIGLAYGVQDKQISGGPNWLNSEKFDIETRMDDAVADELREFSFDQRNLASQPLQALLAERFKLKLHRETKEFPVYALIIAKNGPKIHDSQPGMGLLIGTGQLVSKGARLSMFVHRLSLLTGRPVLDRTGLKGNYDFTLKWMPESQTPYTATADSGSSIFTALPEQLGLALQSQERPVEILVIDHVEKASEN